ncbi:MAG: FkbM family methyltransferase, partial [Phycisphaerales bacterium]|nr:FkbM family methyltransferase [Phycisphaerales bacterium]
AHQFSRFAGEVQQSMGGMAGQVLSLKKRLYEMEAVAALAIEGKRPRAGRRPEFRSQFGEDCALWEVLDRQTSGFYIEAGAFDGRSFAVTHAFDAMGWEGLLVEAIPAKAEECRTNRPDARVVQAALAHEHGGTVTFHVTGDAFGGMLSYLDPNSDHGRQAAAAGTPVTKVEVPRTSLNELLKDHTGPVDAAVIDVEGGEVEVLKGFDLGRFAPRVMLIEDNDLRPNSPLMQYMARQGGDYHLLGNVAMNRIYLHKRESGLLAKLGLKAV